MQGVEFLACFYLALTMNSIKLNEEASFERGHAFKIQNIQTENCFTARYGIGAQGQNAAPDGPRISGDGIGYDDGHPGAVSSCYRRWSDEVQAYFDAVHRGVG